MLHHQWSTEAGKLRVAPAMAPSREPRMDCLAAGRGGERPSTCPRGNRAHEACRANHRRGLRRFTIGVSEGDLRVIAGHGYEGTVLVGFEDGLRFALAPSPPGGWSQNSSIQRPATTLLRTYTLPVGTMWPRRNRPERYARGPSRPAFQMAGGTSDASVGSPQDPGGARRGFPTRGT
jgi:hypothetical protein